MFYDRFRQLCERKGITCNKAALEIGLSNATPTKWKKTGATPVGETLDKIAAYFDVSTDFLLGKEEKAPLAPKSIDAGGADQDKNKIKIAGRDGSFVERTLTDEQLELFKAMLNQLPEVPDDL